MMDTAPKWSPWGKIQSCEQFAPGVYSVTTPSHGGIMAQETTANRLFTVAARKCAFTEYGWICFEEDCAATVALRELMDKKLYTPPVNEYYGPGEYEALIDKCAQRWYPEYWKAREATLQKTAKVKERER